MSKLQRTQLTTVRFRRESVAGLGNVYSSTVRQIITRLHMKTGVVLERVGILTVTLPVPQTLVWTTRSGTPSMVDVERNDVRTAVRRLVDAAVKRRPLQQLRLCIRPIVLIMLSYHVRCIVLRVRRNGISICRIIRS